MCNYTVRIKLPFNNLFYQTGFVLQYCCDLHFSFCSMRNTHSPTLHTVSADSISYFCHNSALFIFLTSRYIQAVRRLKAEGRKLMRTVHLMFVPGKIFDCFPTFQYSLLSKDLNTLGPPTQGFSLMLQVCGCFIETLQGVFQCASEIDVFFLHKITRLY